CGQGTEWPRTF
nr:immunoglobulin light chain junction region [Macaca mulatta]